MSAKRWFIMLLCATFIVAAPIPVLNILIDPFSVFGDPLFGWHSYGMTNNPKTGKFAYLDSRIGMYDAFIIGPSGSSGFSTEALEKHTGLRWYNMFHYGANMDYTKRLTEYLIETHHPKQLLLCLPPVSAVSYSPRIMGVTTAQPLNPFWKLPFLFAEPEYSFKKMDAHAERSYVQSGADVFIAETGEYNKTRRDAEAIGSMHEYLAAYPEFIDPSFWNQGMVYIEECVAAVAKIADMCKRYGIDLIIAAPPIMAENMEAYKVEQVLEFYSRIVELSEFWYFVTTSVSFEPRYFYDTTHFRNNVGEMMIARMFGDDSIYIPDGFGTLVTEANVHSVISEGFAAEIGLAPHQYTKELPILMYHNITEEGGKSSVISASRFSEHMNALFESGYSAVSLEQVRNYVILGHELPERSVLITFDDGYLSNYTHAFPILRELGFNAAFFAIGVTFGKDDMYYKDTDYPLTPHFNNAEAIEMVQSGLISIQSHSFDMHHLIDYDDPYRSGILMMDGEGEQEYIEALKNDHAMMRDLLKDIGEIYAFAYPYGRISPISSILLNELGIQMTFSTNPGINTLIKGLPQSLLELKRFDMDDSISSEDLIGLISGVS